MKKTVTDDTMVILQEDLSVPALINAIEANLFAFFGRLRLWPRMEIHDDPEMLWSISDIVFPAET